MTINRALFSSNSDEHATPTWVYNYWNERFKFTVDAAASHENAKHIRYWDKAQDGLRQSWALERVFLNCPYSQIADWQEKAYLESERNAATVVSLIPSRTDTRWWHRFVEPIRLGLRPGELHFICGRLRFGDAKSGAPFPSAVVVYLPWAQ